MCKFIHCCGELTRELTRELTTGLTRELTRGLTTGGGCRKKSFQFLVDPL